MRITKQELFTTVKQFTEEENKRINRALRSIEWKWEDETARIILANTSPVVRACFRYLRQNKVDSFNHEITYKYEM